MQDREGPRQGTAWFARETAVAQHLTRHGAPVIPLHPDLPPGPHEHLGFPMNFWVYVQRVPASPAPQAIGRTLRQCHDILAGFEHPLPFLGILSETLDILDVRRLRPGGSDFPAPVHAMLRDRIASSQAALRQFPARPLHGDAHLGNLMHTTRGLLLTDWEDTFTGPVEWDVASLIWNAEILERDTATVRAILDAYGPIDPVALRQAMIARAAVITAWYPILYPQPDADRREKLRLRLEWLEANAE